MSLLLLSGSSWRGDPAGRATVRLSKKLFPLLLTADVAALWQLSAALEYQPALAPGLSCFRRQWVTFNPSIQSLSRNRRRNIRHMLTSAPRRHEGACPSSCCGNPRPSVHDCIQKVCSERLSIAPQAGDLPCVRAPRLGAAKSLSPFCSSTGSWATACAVQREWRREPIVSFRQTSSAVASGAPFTPQQSHWSRGFWEMGALGIGNFVGLRTQVSPRRVCGEIQLDAGVASKLRRYLQQ